MASGVFFAPNNQNGFPPSFNSLERQDSVESLTGKIDDLSFKIPTLEVKKSPHTVIYTCSPIEKGLSKLKYIENIKDNLRLRVRARLGEEYIENEATLENQILEKLEIALEELGKELGAQLFTSEDLSDCEDIAIHLKAHLSSFNEQKYDLTRNEFEYFTTGEGRLTKVGNLLTKILEFPQALKDFQLGLWSPDEAKTFTCKKFWEIDVLFNAIDEVFQDETMMRDLLSAKQIRFKEESEITFDDLERPERIWINFADRVFSKAQGVSAKGISERASDDFLSIRAQCRSRIEEQDEIKFQERQKKEDLIKGFKTLRKTWLAPIWLEMNRKALKKGSEGKTNAELIEEHKVRELYLGYDINAGFDAVFEELTEKVLELTSETQGVDFNAISGLLKEHLTQWNARRTLTLKEFQDLSRFLTSQRNSNGGELPLRMKKIFNEVEIKVFEEEIQRRSQVPGLQVSDVEVCFKHLLPVEMNSVLVLIDILFNIENLIEVLNKNSYLEVDLSSFQSPDFLRNFLKKMSSEVQKPKALLACAENQVLKELLFQRYKENVS